MVAQNERIFCDMQHKLLWFETEEQGVTIRCAVTKTALAILEDDALAGPDAMVTTYQRNRARIHSLALSKYHDHRLERNGTAVVTASDVAPTMPH